jgi:hypothetical protein
MASAAGKQNQKERDLQYKTHQLETSLLAMFPNNVHGRIKVHQQIIDVRDSRRYTHKHGFYMITLNQSVTKSHAVLIYKETMADETQSDKKIRFSIYDPNGRFLAKKYEYETKVRSSLPYEVDYSMSPIESINEHGKCAVWCIVVIILWNSFRPEDRLTTLNTFNSKMRESPEIRNTFLVSILQLISDCRDTCSQSKIRQLAHDVYRLICNQCRHGLLT